MNSIIQFPRTLHLLRFILIEELPNEQHRAIKNMIVSDDQEVFNIGMTMFIEKFEELLEIDPEHVPGNASGIFDYNGGGDEGSFSDVVFTEKAEILESTHINSLIRDLGSLMENYCNDYNWWDGEGGSVQITLSFKDFKMSMDYTLNDYEYHCQCEDICQCDNKDKSCDCDGGCICEPIDNAFTQTTTGFLLDSMEEQIENKIIMKRRYGFSDKEKISKSMKEIEQLKSCKSFIQQYEKLISA